jgi:microcompartment protein CcmL/EutN
MDAGVTAAESCFGGTLESWVIIPRPHENVEIVLPIQFTDAVERFRDAVEIPLIPGQLPRP